MSAPVVIRVVGDTRNFEASMGRVAGQLDRTGRVATNAGKLIAGAFAIERVGRGVGALVAGAGSYEAALNTAGAQAELTAKQQARLGLESRKVGLDLNVGAKAAVGAGGELAKAGVKFSDVVQGALKSSVQLSKAGGTDVPAAADAVAGALKIFGIAGSRAAHVADELTSSSLSTRDSVEGVIEAFSSGASAAKQMGYSFEDTVSALTLIADKGILGAEAGTTLRSAFLHLVDPPKKAAETIKKYHLELKTAKGELKGTSALSDELRSKLTGHGITATQTTAALKNLAGTYGFRGLAAIMSRSGTEIDKLEKRLGRAGVAAKIAAQRSQGYQASLAKLKAAGQEASIIAGTPLLAGLAKGADALVKTLGDPATVKALDNFGHTLGDRLTKGVESLEKGLQSGAIQRGLGQITDVADSAADTFGDFARVGGEVLNVVSKIPGPVLQAATAFMLWRKASLALAGGLGAVGARGAAAMATARGTAAAGTASAGAAGGAPIVAAGARGPAAAAAAARVPRTFGPQPLSVLGAQTSVNQAMSAQLGARAAEQAAARQLAAAQGSTAGSGYQRMAARAEAQRAATATAAQARAAEQQAQRARSELQRSQQAIRAAEQRAQQDARMAARTASIRSGVKSGAGGAALGGALGAVAADNFTSAIAMGAAAGSVGGPWGMAGGAVAGAAAVGIKKLFASGARKEAEEFGKQIANGVGQGMDDKRQKRIGNLTKQADKQAEQDRKQAMVRGQLSGTVPGATQTGPSAKSVEIQEKLGKSIAYGVQKRFNRKDFVDPEDVKRLTLETFKNAPPVAQEAGRKSMLGWLRGMEGSRGVAKGAAQRLVDDLGGSFRNFDKEAAGAIKSVDIRNALGAAVGGQKKHIQSLMEANFKAFSGLDKPVKLTYRNLVSEASKQLDRLADKTKHGSAESRKAAETEFNRLAKLVANYSGDATKSVQRFGREGQIAIGNLKPSLDHLTGQLGTNRDAWLDLSKTLSEVDLSPGGTNSPIAGPPMPRRNGGRVFREGGLVDVRASPGELVIFPNGSGGVIPGQPVAADNVHMSVPPKTAFLTYGQQEAFAQGASLDQALRVNAPHFRNGGRAPERFANGGKVSGKVSWFGGPNDASTQGRKTALGVSPNLPGIAIRPGASVESGRPTLGGYFDVHVAGKRAMLRQTDLGPAPSTGRRIDITSAALGRFGFNEKSFPTGATGWAAWLGMDRAKAVRRAAKGADGSALASDIMVGRSRRNVAGLVESTGFARGRAGSGIGPAKSIAEALAQVQTTRSIEQQSSSLGGTRGSGPLARMISKASEIGNKGYQYAWGGGHGRLGVPGKGSRHAHGVGAVGLGFDCSGAVSAVLGAGGLIKAPMTSGALMSWGKKGPGKKLNVLADASHTIMQLGGRNWGTSNENPKGGPGWISRNTMAGRGVVRTAQGFRRGGKAGGVAMPSIVRQGVRMPLMEEGFRGGGRVGDIQTLAHGQVVVVTQADRRVGGGPDVGGQGRNLSNVLLDKAGGGGDLQSRFEKVVAAIEGATYRQMERVRREVQAAANAAGTKRTRAVAQATLSAIDDTMDSRIGGAVGRADFVEKKRASNNDVLALMQTINGTAGTEGGIAAQIRTEQGNLALRPQAQKGLQEAVDRAQKAVNRRPGDEAAQKELEDAKAALGDFGMETLKVRANLADLGRAQEEAAQAARDVADAEREAKAAAAATWASFTTTTKDDGDALDQQADAKQKAAWTAHLAGNEVLRGQLDADAESLRRQAREVRRKDGLTEFDEAASRAANTDDGGVDDAAVRTSKLANAKARAAQADADPTSSSEERAFWQGLITQVTDEIKAGNAESQARDDRDAETRRIEAENEQTRLRLTERADIQGLVGAMATHVIAGGVPMGLAPGFST